MKLAFVLLVAFLATSYQQRLQHNQIFWMPDMYDADEYQFDRPFNPRLFDGEPNYLMNPMTRQGSVYDGYDSVGMINPSIVSPNIYENDQYEGPYAPFKRPMYRSPPANYMNRYWFMDNNFKNLNRKNGNKLQPNNNLFFRNYQDYSYQQRPHEEDPYQNDHPENVERYLAEKQMWQQNIQSRNKYYRPAAAAADPSAQQRFLFNLFPQEIYFPRNTTTRNGMFGKTYGVISTSTVNITSVVTCVDSTEFVAGAGPPSCRRRRRGMEHLLAFDDLVGSPFGLSPTAVEKMETTLAPEPSSYENRNARVNEFLASSKDELVLEDENGDRDKRSFLFYAHTTTITTYQFYSTTITKTVKLLTAATTSALTCLPQGFVICIPNQG